MPDNELVDRARKVLRGETRPFLLRQRPVGLITSDNALTSDKPRAPIVDHLTIELPQPTQRPNVSAALGFA
jgi:hypothetical protein